MKPNLFWPQLSALGLASFLALAGGSQPVSAAPAPLLNDPVDVSADFQNFANTLFLADKLAKFWKSALTSTGSLSNGAGAAERGGSVLASARKLAKPSAEN